MHAEELYDATVLEVELTVQVHAKVLEEESSLTEEGVDPAATVLHEESSLRGATQEAVLVEVERGRLWVLLGDDVVKRVVEVVLSLLIVVVEIRMAALAALAALAVSKLVLL